MKLTIELTPEQICLLQHNPCLQECIHEKHSLWASKHYSNDKVKAEFVALGELQRDINFQVVKAIQISLT